MTFRFARHTNNLDQLKDFYVAILEFEFLGEFENHNGYNGVFIGKTNENWHLEFTISDEVIDFNFGDDDMLVFYPNTKMEYETILNKINSYSIQTIKALNPFWNENGIMFLDPDGYKIVVSNLKSK